MYFLSYNILLPLQTVLSPPPFCNILVNYLNRTLDTKNSYSHYSLDNKDVSKLCKGKLFEVVDENGDVVLQRGRND
jgi:hypothetical protein